MLSSLWTARRSAGSDVMMGLMLCNREDTAGDETIRGNPGPNSVEKELRNLRQTIIKGGIS